MGARLVTNGVVRGKSDAPVQNNPTRSINTIRHSVLCGASRSSDGLSESRARSPIGRFPSTTVRSTVTGSGPCRVHKPSVPRAPRAPRCKVEKDSSGCESPFLYLSFNVFHCCEVSYRRTTRFCDILHWIEEFLGFRWSTIV